MKTLESINKEISDTVIKLNALRREKEDIIKNLKAELNCFKIKTGDTVVYKDLPYKVQYIGKTKFGYRARLRGSIDDFWTDASDLSLMSASLKSIQKENDKLKFEKRRAYDDWQAEVDDYIDIYDDDGQWSPF